MATNPTQQQSWPRLRASPCPVVSLELRLRTQRVKFGCHLTANMTASLSEWAADVALQC